MFLCNYISNPRVSINCMKDNNSKYLRTCSYPIKGHINYISCGPQKFATGKSSITRSFFACAYKSERGIYTGTMLSNSTWWLLTYALCPCTTQPSSYRTISCTLYSPLTIYISSNSQQKHSSSRSRWWTLIKKKRSGSNSSNVRGFCDVSSSLSIYIIKYLHPCKPTYVSML